MINNAKNNPIGNSQLPNMSETIKGWFLPIEFGIVNKHLVDFEEIVTIDLTKTQGVVQPPKPEVIEIQPEGIRNWEWLEIHCLPNIQVNINEFIYWNDLRYKVMQKQNFTPYGFVKYLILEAYSDRAS